MSKNNTNNDNDFTIVESKRTKTKYNVQHNTRDNRNSHKIQNTNDIPIYRPKNAVTTMQQKDNKNDLLKIYDPMIELPGDSMKLMSQWTIWLHENSNSDWSISSYKPIFEINNVGKMWRFLNAFPNLDRSKHQFYIMRDGITPIWEDNNNRTGGICSIMLDCINRNTKDLYDAICVDAFIGICCLVFNESFVSNNGVINGLCFSSKQKNVLIKLWIKEYNNNMNFIDKLPINYLHTLNDLIDFECRKYSSGKLNDLISVQLKKIVPE